MPTNRQTLAIVAMAAALGLCVAADSQPRWVKQLAGAERPQWNEWHNSLAPKGDSLSLPLARNGTTDYVIVVPADVNRIDSRAADELQLWLRELTGADFPIAADSEAPRAHELSVGMTNRVGQPERDRLREAGSRGYAICVRDQRLYLLSASSMGSLLPVFAFLEEDLGVRWYDTTVREPSGDWKKWWEKSKKPLSAERWPAGYSRVPKQPNLTGPIVPRTSTPAFPLRNVDIERAMFPVPWTIRNRLNAGWANEYGLTGYAHGGFGVHTFHYLVPPNVHFAGHPEYYALVNGERRCEHAQLCLSNPEVADVAAEKITGQLKTIPRTRQMVSVSAQDWLGDCECAPCKAAMERTGTYSGLLLGFVNRVAERVEKECPGATITTLAYRQSKQPPRLNMRARDSVAIRFCTDFGASFNWPYHSLRDETVADQRKMYEDWSKISKRMHLWVYPHQYRHKLAPMPNLHAVADNLRFFREMRAESMFVQQNNGYEGWTPLRHWLWAKLAWNPDLDVDELISDFIWGFYGEAAAAVAEYERTLTDYCCTYADFSKMRDWIYAIHDEEMYRHGFVEKARTILNRAAELAEDDAVRERVELLRVGVVYVETVQLYMQMRDGETPPDVTHYSAVTDELQALCTQLGIHGLGFFDGTRTIGGVDEWAAEMRKVHERRFDQRYLPAASWGHWMFRWDSEGRGVADRWFRPDVEEGEGWTRVNVPAFLAKTPAGNAMGTGWYRTTFTLPEGQAGKPAELQFGGVDEQAWVYVNGEQVGEHSLESEFMVGQEVTVADLWNRPFEIVVPAERLHVGENVLAVRIHNSAYNAGIHQPVRIYLPDAAYRDACDGTVLKETFETVKTGGIPATWKRHIQERDGQVFGIAEVRRHFVRGPTLHLRDQRSHVAVWSASDEALPAGGEWTVQFDFRLTGGLVYKASDVGPYKAAAAGAIFGLKRGDPGSPDFLALVQLNNDEDAGKPVTLLGLGEVLATDVTPDRWHRLVIRRDGATWHFYLDDELRKTVQGRDTDLRGYAFGSFHNWPHVAQDIHYTDLKIGNFVKVHP